MDFVGKENTQNPLIRRNELKTVHCVSCCVIVMKTVHTRTGLCVCLHVYACECYMAINDFQTPESLN